MRDTGCRDNCFITGGFSNWRKSTEKFDKHEKSGAHREAASYLLNSQNRPLSAVFSNASVQQQTRAKAAHTLLFRRIRFIGRQGLPLRGHDHRSGLLWQLMVERSHEHPDVREWMKRRNNWMDDKIQNEIVDMFAAVIQRKISSEVQSCSFLALPQMEPPTLQGMNNFLFQCNIATQSFKCTTSFWASTPLQIQQH